MIDFKCRPIRSSYFFRFRAMPPPTIFGLKPPLPTTHASNINDPVPFLDSMRSHPFHVYKYRSGRVISNNRYLMKVIHTNVHSDELYCLLAANDVAGCGRIPPCSKGCCCWCCGCCCVKLVWPNRAVSCSHGAVGNKPSGVPLCIIQRQNKRASPE